MRAVQCQHLSRSGCLTIRSCYDVTPSKAVDNLQDMEMDWDDEDDDFGSDEE
jgi:hypothetical protein